MEVVPPSQRVDVAFESTCSSPYITAPSSPRRSSSSVGGGGGIFFSAPTSPRLASAFFLQLNNLSLLASDDGGGPSSQPEFGSEIRSYNYEDYNEEEEKEEFEFSGQLDRAYALSAADELFDDGKIKPLGMDYAATDLGHSMRIFPEKTRKEEENGRVPKQSHRGRPERITDSSSLSSASISSVRKGSRSLSPFRVSDFAFDRKEKKQKNTNSRKPPSPSSSSANSSSSVSSSMAAAASPTAKGNRKWRLRDFLLFRSASEGRASTAGNDPLRKFYAPLQSKKKGEEDSNLKAESFRSAESASGSTSRRRRTSGAGSVRSSSTSPHELHYKTNRAAAEEMRRRTFLPYKPDLLGCLGFGSVSSVHEISRGLGSLTRG